MCDGSATHFYELFIANDISLDTKLGMFKIWIRTFLEADNVSAKQGLILCLIAVLKHIFHIDIDLFLALINFLKKLAEEGSIFKALLKLRIRRLRKYGCEIAEY